MPLVHVYVLLGSAHAFPNLCAFEFHSHTRLRPFLFTSCEYLNGPYLSQPYLFTSSADNFQFWHSHNFKRDICTVSLYKTRGKTIRMHKTEIILNCDYFYVRRSSHRKKVHHVIRNTRIGVSLISIGQIWYWTYRHAHPHNLSIDLVVRFISRSNFISQFPVSPHSSSSFALVSCWDFHINSKWSY